MQEELSPVFNIKRLTPNNAVSMLKKMHNKKILKSTRGYKMTSDDQRFKLIQQVLDKELSLKDVKISLK